MVGSGDSHGVSERDSRADFLSQKSFQGFSWEVHG